MISPSLSVMAVLDEKKLLKVIRRSLPQSSKLGNSQKVNGMNSQKFFFGQPVIRLGVKTHFDFSSELFSRSSVPRCVP
jgi:hypothetical protein